MIPNGRDGEADHSPQCLKWRRRGKVGRARPILAFHLPCYEPGAVVR